MHDDPLRIAILSAHATLLVGDEDERAREVCIEQVGRCLAEAGHRVDVLARRDDAGQRPAVDRRPGLRVLHIDDGRVPPKRLLDPMPAFARQAERLLAASPRYDVLHAEGFMSGWVGLQLQERFGVPLVTSLHALGRLHEGDPDVFLPERIAIEDRLVQRSDALIAACPQDKRDLVKHYPASTAQIHDVPGGVDGTQFRPLGKGAARHALGLPIDGFVVLQPGRLAPGGGIDAAIRAIARLDAALSPALYVAGVTSDAEIARLNALARDCGAGARLQFLGARSDAERACWHAAADVCLTTAVAAPCTPALEAMACATPVIAARVPGIRQVVLDDRTGYLVAPNDGAALAAKLELLARQPLLARRLGAAGLQRVRSYFTWEQVAAQMVDVFRWVRLARRRPLDAHAAPRARPLLHLVQPPAFRPTGVGTRGAARGVPS